MKDEKTIQRACHENGNHWYEIPQLNGKDHGLCRVWYDNGKRKYEINFVEGLYDGKYVIWRDNGSICLLRSYKQDNQHGVGLGFKY